MSGSDHLNITNEMLFNAIEAVAVRLNAQEAIIAVIASKLRITKDEAFAKLDFLELGEREHWLPQIRRAITQTLNPRH